MGWSVGRCSPRQTEKVSNRLVVALALSWIWDTNVAPDFFNPSVIAPSRRNVLHNSWGRARSTSLQKQIIGISCQILGILTTVPLNLFWTAQFFQINKTTATAVWA